MTGYAAWPCVHVRFAAVEVGKFALLSSQTDRLFSHGLCVCVVCILDVAAVVAGMFILPIANLLTAETVMFIAMLCVWNAGIITQTEVRS